MYWTCRGFTNWLEIGKSLTRDGKSQIEEHCDESLNHGHYMSLYKLITWIKAVSHHPPVFHRMFQYFPTFCYPIWLQQSVQALGGKNDDSNLVCLMDLLFLVPDLVQRAIQGQSLCWLHPGRLAWHLQITRLERKMIFQTSMIMFHVNLQGCNLRLSKIIKWIIVRLCLDSRYTGRECDLVSRGTLSLQSLLTWPKSSIEIHH